MRQVSEWMTRDVVTLKETDDLTRADMLLARERIRHLPVVRGRKLVGLVTHRDLLRALATAGGEVRSGKLWAMDVMRRDVTTVHPDTPLREALQVLLSHKYGCLPVVDEANQLVGIITEHDFARFAGALLEELDLRETAREFR
jgi:CBS domain-containing protein